MENTFYTVEQIAGLLEIHPKTIQRYIREGKLRAVKIGKGWRVTGHDLSTFTENTASGTPKEDRSGTDAQLTALASSVVDITVPGKAEAIRIMNTLTAAMNANPPEYGRSSMHAQFIENDFMVRVTLWGSVRFMAAMMDAIAMLSENNNEE